MPPTRTPPTSRQTSNVSTSRQPPLHHAESEPDLHSNANITERKKRKCDGQYTDETDISVLIKEMFSAFSKEQEKRFQELKTSMEVMSTKYDDFWAKITSLEKERKADKILILELEEKIENLERKSRGTGIEIRNLPRQNSETKETLCSEIVQLGKILNVNMESNIKDVYRLKSKDNSNPVVVELTTVIMKDKVLKAVKSFNKTKAKGEKLNTTHLNPGYQLKPMYIAETLTYKTQRLYFLARQFKNSHGYKFCWTTNGIVYVKKSEESAHIRINHDTDLDKLRNTI